MKKINRSFRLVSNEVRDNCIGAIISEHASSETPLTVKLTNATEQRSTAQNRLYWLWIKHFSEHTGAEPDDVHFDFKRRFLLRIYYTADPDFAAMCDSIKAVKELDFAQYESISKQVISLTSTTKATTEQMTEYLNSISRFCYRHGVLLPIPEELHFAIR